MQWNTLTPDSKKAHWSWMNQRLGRTCHPGGPPNSKQRPTSEGRDMQAESQMLIGGAITTKPEKKLTSQRQPTAPGRFCVM
jgi:hypothetical protein